MKIDLAKQLADETPDAVIMAPDGTPAVRSYERPARS
jgi:hypothetical protein